MRLPPLVLPACYTHPTPQDDVSLWSAVSELREAVNGTLEKARIGKAIGSSLDARVLLHVSDVALRGRLRDLDARHNGVDDLRYIFIVSQVCGMEGGRDAGTGLWRLW